MRLGQLLLTLALVAGGILVYDMVRRDPEPAREPSVGPIAPRDEPRVVRDTAETPRLSGDAVEDLIRRFDVLEKRLTSLEAGRGTGTAASVVEGGRLAASDRPATRDEEGEEPPTFRLPDVREGEQPAFDAAVVRDFRAYLEEVERQRQEERRIEQIRNQLARLDLRMTGDQETTVIGETLRFQTRRTELYSELNKRRATPEERDAAMDSLRSEYESALSRVLPASDVQKLLEGPGRIFGGGRRLDRARSVPDSR